MITTGFQNSIFWFCSTVELKDLTLGQTAKIGEFLGFLAESISLFFVVIYSKERSYSNKNQS